MKPGSLTRSRSSGVMLVECVVYIAVFMVILSLAFMALHRTWKTHALLRRNSQDVAAALRAGEQWRADIRGATGPVGVTGDWLFQIPVSQGAVIYRLENGILRREAPGCASSVILRNVRSAEMKPDQRERVAAWSWELELNSKKSKLRPLFTFIAVAPPAKP